MLAAVHVPSAPAAAAVAPAPAAEPSVLLAADPRTFEQAVLSSARPTVVVFAADWCGSSRAFGPAFAALARRFGDKVRFVQVDTEATPELAQAQTVRAVPTLRCYWHGRVVAEVVGSRTAAEVERVVRRHARRGEPLHTRVRHLLPRRRPTA